MKVHENFRTVCAAGSGLSNTAQPSDRAGGTQALHFVPFRSRTGQLRLADRLEFPMAQRPALTPLVAALPPTVPSSDRSIRSATAVAAPSGRASAPMRAVSARRRRSSRPCGRLRPDMWMYCDPDNFDLKAAIAAHLGVGFRQRRRRRRHRRAAQPRRAHDDLARPARSSPRSAPIRPSTSMSPVSAGGWSPCPSADDRESLDGLLAAVKRENAPLVYLSNPDNPMGTWWEAGDILRFIEALPETTMLVIDEAYGELGPDLGPDADRRVAAPTSSGCAPSRRPTDLPASAAATPSATRRLHRRRRESPQPLRRQPHGAGRRRGRARRPGLSQRK